MLQNGKNKAAVKKAYEIAYALCRTSTRIPEKGFAGMVQTEGVGLLEAVAKEDYAKASKTLLAIEYFIRLGVDMNFVSPANGEVFFQEIGILNSAIAGLSISILEEDIDVSNFFSKEIVREKHDRKYPQEVREAIQRESGNGGNGSGNEAAIRQSAILDRIRQSGNCRMKDIQELLPELSERTLRYDLQSLVEQNAVERVGTGGPMVFYRIRQTAKVT